MKLKYYLRTLGIGIVVTAILMGAGGKQQLSDEEIRARASRLGMIEAGSATLSTFIADEFQNEGKQDTPEVELNTDGEAEVTAEQPEADLAVSAEAAIQEPESSDPEEAESESAEPESVEAGSAETEQPESEPETTEEIVETEEITSVKPEAESGETVTIQVVGGSSSVSVSRQLYEAGLVDSAEKYDRFLCAGGYDKVISVGVYEIPAGSTEEEIAKIITRRK